MTTIAAPTVLPANAAEAAPTANATVESAEVLAKEETATMFPIKTVPAVVASDYDVKMQQAADDAEVVKEILVEGQGKAVEGEKLERSEQLPKVEGAVAPSCAVVVGNGDMDADIDDRTDQGQSSRFQGDDLAGKRKAAEAKEEKPVVEKRTRNNRYPFGTKIWKNFGEGLGWFSGDISKIDEDFYTVLYDDGDQEDLEEVEIDQLIKDAKARPMLDLFEMFGVSKKEIEQQVKKLEIPSLAPNQKKHMTQVVHFYLYMLERQLLWCRRRKYLHQQRASKKNGSVPEEFKFSRNQIFRNYFACNNYRELDRGTAYFRSHVLKLWDKRKNNMTRQEWIQQIFWAAYCYRVVNRVESFDNDENPTRGIPQLEDWNEDWKNYIRSQRQKGVSFFTAAHQTTNYEQYMKWMDEAVELGGNDICCASREIFAAGIDLDKVFKIVRTFDGCGDFFAWQITCDLVEARCLGNDVDENTFTQLGPGAISGLRLIFGDSIQKKDNLKLAKTLLELQDVVFDDLLQKSFPRWNEQPITLKAIEHALCEFSKYTKISNVLQQGNATVAGQRKWAIGTSKSKLDASKRCFYKTIQQCKAFSNKDDDDCCERCDSCFLMYCQSCEAEPFSDSRFSEGSNDAAAGWVCSRCRKFNEGLNFS